MTQHKVWKNVLAALALAALLQPALPARAAVEQLLEFAGLEDDPSKSLQELILDVATETQAMWAARSKAGGQRIPKNSTAAAPNSESVTQPTQPAEEPKGDDDVARIKEAIAEAKDVPALRMVFAKDKEKFSINPELQAAFKDRKAQLDKEGN